MPARILGDAAMLEEPAAFDNHGIEADGTQTGDVMQTCFEGEVVITGVSCRLPQSDNMQEFRDNLMEGIDMVTEDDSRWLPGLYGLPKRSGKLKDLSKFDAAFFGVHPKQAHRMDSQQRMLLEVTYEAIVDAGVNPDTLRGSKTGVFIGASASESHDAWSGDPESTVGYTMTGCTRSMFANRLSYFFDFKGPSYTIDTACSSSLLALDQALQSIRSGQCDSAIVGGSNLCLNPMSALQFLKLGMLSPDGMCKSFDAEGNGYCRSEGIVALFLQKESHAKRIYCTVVHSKTNSDGNKQQGITFPSGLVQKRLLTEVYSEACIDPATVSYVEAHGTGTKAGDPQEVNTIADVFCKGRQGPLLIGSIKSNMGHSEPVSGLAAVAKVIVAMEEQVIPRNLHYKTPNTDIPGLVSGQLEVVTEKRCWTGGIVGVNSFGFGGSNVHAVLKSNSRSTDQDICKKAEDLQKQKQLFLYSSRTEEGLKSMMTKVREHPDDRGLHALLHETAYMPQTSHPYRGFTILNGTQEINIQKTSPERPPVWYVFAGMGTQWHGMGRSMMSLDIFKQSILRSDNVLQPYGIQLYDMLMFGEPDTFDGIVSSFVGIAAIQVALVDVLMSMGVHADGIVGHSVGELGCAYADGCLSAEETVLAAYWRGYCIQSAQLPPGGMAAVGLTWQEALEQCPEGVVPACHNAEETVTISGPKESVAKFVAELKERNVFAKEVNSAGVAFHSYYMADIAPALREALNNVIKSPRLRTDRWISSSIPEAQWLTGLARWSSADYHVNNLVSPVLFQEALQHVPSNAVVIEIAPHCLLQAILKRSLSSDCCIMGLMKRDHPDNIEFCFTSLGRCYQNGVKVNPLGLSPPVSFPVPAGTPMVAPLVHWDHTQSWDFPKVDMFLSAAGSASGCGFDIDMSPDSEYRYLIGHKIDGRVLFPATGYLVLVWKAFSRLLGQQFDETPVVFQDIDIHRATILPDSGKVHFDVTIMPGTGNFEVLEGGAVTATGRVMSPDTEGMMIPDLIIDTNEEFVLNTADIYKELRLRGYDYGPTFQGIVAASLSGETGQLRWTGEWIAYLDTMLQITLLSQPGQGLCLPTRIKSVTIHPKQHLDRVEQLTVDTNGFPVKVDPFCDKCTSGGVIVHGLHATSAPRRHDYHHPLLERYIFVPYQEPEMKVSQELLRYTSACHRCVKGALNRDLCSGRNMLHIEAQHKHCVFENGHSKDENIEDEFSDEHKFGYLKLLHKLFSADSKSMSGEAIQQLIEDHSDWLHTDIMLNSLNVPDILKPCFDLVVENCNTNYLRILEVMDSRLSDHLLPLLASHPLLHPAYTVATTIRAQQDRLSDKGAIEVADWTPTVDGLVKGRKKSHLVIARNIMCKEQDIVTAFRNLSECLEEGGFLLVEEITDNFHLGCLFDNLESGCDVEKVQKRTMDCYNTRDQWHHIFSQQGFVVVKEISDGILSSLFLLKKGVSACREKQTVLNVSACNLNWVEDLKEKLAEVQTRDKGENLWLVSETHPSGLVGMVNCLRQEPGGERIRCLLNDGRSPLPDLEAAITNQLPFDLVMNVYRDGQWGSFRHLPLPPVKPEPVEHAFVNVLTRGDLSSLHWIHSPLQHFTPEGSRELCTVNYASLNFRDVMLATGKLPPDAIPGNMAAQECMLGMEFSGYDSQGRRVMGLVPAKGLATHVDTNKHFLWTVPDNWSLEEAASVPVVYTTAYYALVVRGNLHHGDRVLVHAGSGGVGQAAIAIALHNNCEVFVTVSTQEKREYLKARFPRLDDGHFFNSRDTSFEAGILTATKGKGVDIVLNSLAEEKLQASLRVLAQHGRFLEIGKYDLSNNTALGMSIFLKNISFHGILLDSLFDDDNRDWAHVSKCLEEGIRSGAVKPLNTTVFPRDEVEAAFRFMAKGKHIGKVLIKVSEEEQSSTSDLSVVALPRSACDPRKIYILTGGLGGFGLELAQWLIERGARRLVLTSRSGITTGYQRRKLQQLKRLGAEITISSHNVCNQSQTRELLATNRPVGGIFHLAMVLRDGFIENLTEEKFLKVFEPKVTGTMNLDSLSREICKESCDWFVVFSSISCGRGNAGQSNYGFANSLMERVCERRQADGFPGLAIQWGVIGDVGVFQETMGTNDTELVGTLPQRITSCLATLDLFLSQSEPVVSSFIPVERQEGTNSALTSGPDLVHAVCHILGVNEPSEVNADTSLGDLGLDSLMGVEVKQTLERGFNLSLPMKDIRQLTINKLQDIQSGTQSEHKEASNQSDKLPSNQGLFIQPKELILKLNDCAKDTEPMYIIHPIEGDVSCLRSLSAHLNFPVYGIQSTSEVPHTSISDMAAFYIQSIQEHTQGQPFHLAGYSFGACVAIEMAMQLQNIIQSGQAPQDGSRLRTLSLLDGSQKFVATHTQNYMERFAISNMAQAETAALCTFVEKFTQENIQEVASKMKTAANFEERVALAVERVGSIHTNLSTEELTATSKSYAQKLIIASQNIAIGKYSGDITLVTAATSQIHALDKDYGLNEICSGHVHVTNVAGDHSSFITGESAVMVADILNKLMD